MIVKNEEAVLERCLKSIKNFVDEIIVVDTGSTDNTKKIAKKFTNKIFDFVWCDDFSSARNFAAQKANCEYIIWLDADDVVPQKTLKQLINLKPKLSADVYMLKYDIAFLNGKPTFSYYRERIIKNCKNCVWQGAVHECIVPFGIVEYIDMGIWHKKEKQEISSRNLQIYKKLSTQRVLSSREQYYYGRELFDHKKYVQCINVLTKFIKNNDAWVENVIDACVLVSECYQAKSDSANQFKWLIKTFLFDTPRANICCKLGDFFLLQKKYDTAIFWFKTATNLKDVSLKGAFVEPTYYCYYPNLQLCYIYSLLGDNANAQKFNELAGRQFKGAEYLHNKKYFESVKII